MAIHGNARIGGVLVTTHRAHARTRTRTREDGTVMVINHPNIVREERLNYIKLHVYDKILLKITPRSFIARLYMHEHCIRM